jgi:chemotaxis protein methyltransferase WspC
MSRDRYFHHVGNNYRLDEAVRGLVEFHHANILDPGFFSLKEPYDAIFCRNLLIYLVTASRKLVMDTLDRLLTPDGLLFVGHAEATPGLDARFEAIDESGSFAYRRKKESSKRALGRSTPQRARAPATSSAQVRPAKLIPKLTTIAKVPPRQSSADLPGVTQPPESPLLEQASLLANAHRHREAVQLCEKSIRQDGPKPEAYLLMGMIHQATGALDKAEAALSKVVYLDPTHDEALLSLALISERRGDAKAAASYRRRVDRARRTKEPR